MKVLEEFREFINKGNVVDPGVSAPRHARRRQGRPTTTVVAGSASSFRLRYDENPASATIPSRTPSGLVYMPGFQPFSDSIDTLAEANLIYTSSEPTSQHSSFRPGQAGPGYPGPPS
jgi:hypothetical protein